MRQLLDRLANPLHLVLALVTLWLLASSFWLGMYRRVPDEPGLLNASHLLLGFATLGIGLLYALACTLGGRWRLYFPWLAGDAGAVLRDLRGLVRGERPMSEGGGLFGAIEGLLLLALLGAAASGAMWYATQGTDTALAWRSAHAQAAWSFAALLLLHLLSVSVHLLDLIRD